MIDPIKVLKRAWHILWNYRILWLFGLILAMTTGGGNGGGGGNSGYRFSGGNGNQTGGNIDRWFQEFFRPLNQMPEQQLINILIWIGVGLLCFFLVIGIIFAIARYVSETAVIRMVDEYEASELKVGFRQGWKYGWSRTSWRLFLINLLVSLPAILLMLFFLLLGIGVYFLASGGSEFAKVTGIVAGIGLFFLLLFVVILLEVVLKLLREFFWRVCALENAGVMESLKRGFELVKRNWQSVGLMWLVMIGLGIGMAIAMIILFFILIPLYIVMAIPAVIVAGIPALIVFGITNLFLSTPLAAIVALIIGLPLFFMVAFSPLVLLGAWVQVFKSSVWTLTYRELLVLDDLTSAELEPASA